MYGRALARNNGLKVPLHSVFPVFPVSPVFPVNYACFSIPEGARIFRLGRLGRLFRLGRLRPRSHRYVDEGGISPDRRAYTAAWVRLFTCSFSMILLR